MGRVANGEITNHMIMARTKTQGKQTNDGPKARKRQIRLDTFSKFIAKNHNKKSLEGIFQTKIRTGFDETEDIVGHGKNNAPKIHFGTIVSDKRKTEEIRPYPATNLGRKTIIVSVD